jgi:outer membrane protein assembly factor BamB
MDPDTNSQSASALKSILLLTARGTAVVSGIFTIVVAILIIISWMQLKQVTPADSPVIKQLQTEMANRPGDSGLKEDIRALHLLSRKAYFTNITFINYGGIMLLCGAGLLLVSVKIMSSITPAVPHPQKCEGMSMEPDRSLSRWAVGALCAGIAVVGVYVSYLSRQEYKRVYSGMQAHIDTLVEPDSGFKPESGSAAAGDPLENWASFRGPFGLGLAVNVMPPTNWNGITSNNVSWLSEIPLPGFNSPVVWSNRIFLSGADESTQEIYCFNADNGELLWTHPVDDVPRQPDEMQEITEDTGFAAPTLATDGSRVCAIFASGDCVCLDFTGNRLWSRSLGVPNISYGYASSPLIYRDTLIIQYDTEEHGHVMALSLADGSPVWETPREYGSSWSSPVLVPVEDRILLVLNAVPIVAAYNPENGTLLWECECLGGEVAPSPAYAEGVVFSANEYSTLTAIDAVSGTNLWQTYDNLPEVASPLAVSNCLYMATSGGTLSCLNTEDGSEFWTWETDNGFYSSPVYAGGYIYVTDMRGETYIFREGTNMVLAGSHPLGESSVCIPAFKGSRMYVRGRDYLYCIGK